jgi:hypothetical protein
MFEPTEEIFSKDGIWITGGWELDYRRMGIFA